MRCAVVGDPIGHSQSPVLHRAGYDAVGLSWTYDAVAVPSGTLASFVSSLDAEWRGLSVTAPLKREAAALVSSASPVVTSSGVANTLVRSSPGSWSAENTDVPGAAAALRERYSGPVTSATILGGGATAVSTGLALVSLGAREITLLVRDAARSASAVSVLAAHPTGPTVTVAPLSSGTVVGEVLVSTIPAAAQTPDLVSRCSGVPVLFEVTYHPWPTPLAAASSGEQALVTGLDLLVHQAALQFELFTGTPAADVLTPMRAALEVPRAE